MSLFNSVKTGVRDDRGSVALQFGLCAVLLMAVTGGAIDLARWSHAKRTTAAALDAAVLAGAHALQLDQTNITHAIATAQTMYSQNLTGRPTVSSDTVTFVAADSNTAITATGAATIDTTLLRVVGINSLTVVNDAGASFPKATVKSGGAAGGNIEVSIMLDVTGSMCDDGVGPCTTGTKINGLKAAANDLIGIVVSTNQSTYTSKAAIVPFSTRVRVGPDGGGGAAMKAYTNLDPTWTGWYNMCTQSTGGGASETNGSWACQQYTVQQETNWLIKPCVTDRFYDSGWLFDSTDIAPGSGTWLNAHDGSRMPVATDSSSTAATTKTGHSAADPADFWNYDDGTCADVAAGNEILPLTADKTALTNRINALEAYGSTAGALGTAWSWYLLSPNWSSIFGNLYGNSTRPGSYSDVTTIQANGAPTLRKVAVLMTDGGYNTYRGWKEQNQQEVSNYAIEVCTNMKAKGIEVYTVGFALNELSAAEQTIARATLQACGTDIKHFYDTLTVPQLQQAFRDIGSSMTKLYLSK